MIIGCSGNNKSELPLEIGSLKNLAVIETNLDEVPEFEPVPVTTFGNEEESVIGMPASIRADDSKLEQSLIKYKY